MPWPDPTINEPSLVTLMEWDNEDRCQATDGCWLGPDDEMCEHGHPSWAIVLRFSPDEPGE